MRILFSAVPAFGHILPFVPLARAAVEAGHELRLLTSSGISVAIAEDLPDVPVIGAGPMPDVLFAEVAHRFPGADPANDPQPETVAEFFAGTRVDLTADDALTLATDWDPDLIIAEATDFVGPLVASSLGVPWSVLAFGPAVPDEFVAPMREVALSRYSKRGLAPTAPGNYIDPSPISLQPEGWLAPANRLPFRAEAHRRPGVEQWSPSPRTDGKKSVLVTLGTVFTDIGVVEMILDSIDVDRYEVVATLGVVPGLSRPSGEGVEFVDFVPMSELLNDVDVVVNSGGAGTVLASLSRGLPMVVFPQGADQFINAQRSAELGSALVVNYPSAVGAAIDTVMGDGRFSVAARAAAEEISMAPCPGDVIAELERQHLGGLASNGL